MDFNKGKKSSKQLIIGVIKMKLQNFKAIKVFDFFPLRSQLDSINSKPKLLIVCCVIDDQGKNNMPQLIISYK